MSHSEKFLREALLALSLCNSLVEISLIKYVAVVHFMQTRGRPDFGFGFGAECGQNSVFGRHSVLADSSHTTFGALSVSACCSW